MPTLNMKMVRFVDHSFPKWVECEFSDERNIKHIIQEKLPVIYGENDDPEPGDLPLEIRVDCMIESESVDENQQKLVEIRLDHRIETTTGRTTFTVLDSIVND